MASEWETAGVTGDFLRALRSETAYRNRDRDAALAVDYDWAISRLLARLFLKAERTPPPVTMESLRKALKPELLPALDELIANGVIRHVMGEISVAEKARRRLGDLSLSDAQAECVRAVSAALQAAWDPKWIVPRQLAEEIRAAHLQAYPGTPPFEEEGWRGVAAVQGDRLELNLRMGLHQTLSARVAGHLWAGPGTRGAFLRWLDLVRELRGWVDAPEDLPARLRSTLVEAAVYALLAEPDLVATWPEDLRKALLDNERPYDPAPSGTPRSNDTLAQMISRTHDDPVWSNVVHQDAREAVSGVVALVVRHDEVSSASRAASIQRLLREAPRRPYILLSLLHMIPFQRPEALSWLALEPDLTSAALTFLEHLQPSDQTYSEEWSAALRRRERGKLAAFEQLLPVLRKGLDQPDSSGWPLMVAECLTALAASAAQWSFHRPDDTEIRAEFASRRLSLYVELLESVACRQPWESLIGEPLSRVATLLSESASAALSDGTIPLPQWRALAALLMMEAPSVPRSQIADLLAQQAVQFLTTEEHEGRPVSWNIDGIPRSHLSWPEIMRHASAERREALLQALDLESKTRNQRALVERLVAKVASSVPSNVRWVVTWNLTHQVRWALRVLLQLHHAEHVPSVRSKIARSIVTNLALHSTHGDDRLPIFDRMLIGAADDGGDLLTEALQEVNDFTGESRQDAGSRWLSTLVDPTVLLAVISQGSEDLAEIARVRLATLDFAAYVDGEFMLPKLARGALAAATAGDVERTRAILERVERTLPDGHPYRPRWAMTTFRARLLLARTPAEVDAVAIPENLPADEDRPEGWTFAQLKEHHRARALLETDPLQAQEVLVRLVQESPQNAEAVVDLFAVRLKAARATTGSSRAIIARDALAAIGPLVDRLRSAGRSVMESLQVSLLVAQDLVDNDVEIDRLWDALPLRLRFQEPAIRAKVQSLVRRGKREDASEIVDAAAEFLRASPPAWLAAVRADLENKRDLQATPALARTELVYQDIRSAYLELLALPADNQVAYVAPRGVRGLGDYLLMQHHEVARELLLRVSTVRHAKDEDKYSDLFVSLLRMKLAELRWQVLDQPRGGRSASGGSPGGKGGVGRRDWVVRQHIAELAIGEAFRLSSLGATGEHIAAEHFQKLPGYDPTQAQCRIIVLLAEVAKFDEFCAKYEAVLAEKWTGGKVVSIKPPGAVATRAIRVFRTTAGNPPVTTDHLVVHID